MNYVRNITVTTASLALAFVSAVPTFALNPQPEPPGVQSAHTNAQHTFARKQLHITRHTLHKKSVSSPSDSVHLNPQPEPPGITHAHTIMQSSSVSSATTVNTSRILHLNPQPEPPG